MIDKEIYIDPFMLKAERIDFIKNYKSTKKKRLDANMKMNQKVVKNIQICDVPKLASDAWETNRFTVLIRDMDNHQNFTEIHEMVNGTFYLFGFYSLYVFCKLFNVSY